MRVIWAPRRPVAACLGRPRSTGLLYLPAVQTFESRPLRRSRALERRPQSRGVPCNRGRLAVAGGEMVRVLRWLTMIAATLLIAFGCAMLTWRFGLPLLHTNVRSSDRLLLALGAATVVGAVVALPLAWWAGHEASEAGDWTEFVEQFGPSLKSPRLPTVAEVNPYSIGVEASAYVGGNTRPPYCPRDIDGALDAALASSSFVLVSGDSAAGKSRASYEAALRAFPDRTIVVPKADAPLDRLF